MPIKFLSSKRSAIRSRSTTKLKEAGITLVTTSFYKGMGLKTEAEEFEINARLIRRGRTRSRAENGGLCRRDVVLRDLE